MSSEREYCAYPSSKKIRYLESLSYTLSHKVFTLYVLFCAKKGFLIVTLNKNLSTCIVFWKPVHFSIECWFQPPLIRYCILHVCPLNKKCLEHTLWWLHSFPSLWDISYTIFTTFKYTHWLIQQFTCRHFFGLGSRLQFQHKRMPWTPRLCKELKNLSLSLSTWYIKSFSKEYYYSLSINKAPSKQTHQPLWSPPTRVLSANLWRHNLRLAMSFFLSHQTWLCKFSVKISWHLVHLIICYSYSDLYYKLINVLSMTRYRCETLEDSKAVFTSATCTSLDISTTVPLYQISLCFFPRILLPILISLSKKYWSVPFVKERRSTAL